MIIMIKQVIRRAGKIKMLICGLDVFLFLYHHVLEPALISFFFFFQMQMFMNKYLELKIVQYSCKGYNFTISSISGKRDFEDFLGNNLQHS